MEAILERLCGQRGLSSKAFAELLVEEAVRLTKSEMAYFAVTDDEVRQLTMLAWSKNAMVCPFYQHHIPIHATMYRTNVSRYCDGNQASCAIHQVMQEACFLNVPKDLYPHQTFRGAEILKK